MDATSCTLYSSGLKGAEAAFGEAAENLNIKEVIYSFEGHKLARDKNVVILGREQLERGDISMELASRMLNRTYYETEKIRKERDALRARLNMLGFSWMIEPPQGGEGE